MPLWMDKRSTEVDLDHNCLPEISNVCSGCPTAIQEGEVCVNGPNVMQGYNNLPDASAEVFFDYDGKRCDTIRNDAIRKEHAGIIRRI